MKATITLSQAQIIDAIEMFLAEEGVNLQAKKDAIRLEITPGFNSNDPRECSTASVTAVIDVEISGKGKV